MKTPFWDDRCVELGDQREAEEEILEYSQAAGQELEDLDNTVKPNA